MSATTQINKPYVQILHNGDPDPDTRQFKVCLITRTLEYAGSALVYVKVPAVYSNNNFYVILLELTTNSTQADTDAIIAVNNGYKHHFQKVEYSVKGSNQAIVVICKDLDNYQRITKIRYEDAEEASDGG